MAGIGFTLRKVISRGELGSTFQAALSGIMIVAGPWILSIITLSLINRYLSLVMAENSGLFVGQLIYSYSSSLVLFSPVHLLFTRLIADLIWEERENEASRLLLWFILFTAAASLVLSLPTILTAPYEGISRPGLFRLASVLFYLSINLIWLILLYTSLLRWYGRILWLMAFGMAIAVLLIWLWGQSAGLGGAMMGFAVGHFLIAAMLLIIGLRAYKPSPSGQGWSDIADYLWRYRDLIAAGTLANAAIWADKIIYWFTRGSRIEGSMLTIYPAYDQVVYYANLIMVPGLVYFVIFGETGFYTYLRKFLITLTRGSYAQIQQSKFAMIRSMNRELANQQLFQGGIVLVAILLASSIFSGEAISPTLFQISSAGVFFLLGFMTVINYLYYFELYRLALVSAVLFFTLNLVLTLGLEALFYFGLLPLPVPAGLSFLLSVMIAAAAAYRYLASSAKTMDRLLLTR